MRRHLFTSGSPALLTARAHPAPMVGLRLAHAEARLAMADGDDAVADHHHIGVPGLFRQLPLGRQQPPQQAVKTLAIEVEDASTAMPGLGTMVDQPLDLHRANAPLVATLNSMRTELHPTPPEPDSAHLCRPSMALRIPSLLASSQAQRKDMSRNLTRKYWAAAQVNHWSRSCAANFIRRCSTGKRRIDASTIRTDPPGVRRDWRARAG
ncbi:hypothetical protein D9M68_607540 [compost metagenome]